MPGLLDWADPCVDAQNKFKSSSEAARARADQVIQELFRGTVGNLLMAAGNAWAAGQREPGEIAKWIRVTSGVSVGDIAKYGLQGGENSVVNQVLGGENSVLRQAIKAVDPSTWDLGITVPTYRLDLGPIKIDLPKF